MFNDFMYVGGRITISKVLTTPFFSQHFFGTRNRIIGMRIKKFKADTGFSIRRMNFFKLLHNFVITNKWTGMLFEMQEKPIFDTRISQDKLYPICHSCLFPRLVKRLMRRYLYIHNTPYFFILNALFCLSFHFIKGTLNHLDGLRFIGTKYLNGGQP